MITCSNLSSPDHVERNFPIVLIIITVDDIWLFLNNLSFIVADLLLFFYAIVSHGTQIDFRSLV